MNAKTTMTALGSILAPALLTGTAHAAASTHTVYSSGILVLAFLGFCALVVVVQLIPAMMTLYGMLKTAFENRKEAAVETASRN